MDPLTLFADDRYRIRPFAAADATALYGAVRASIAELGAWMDWCSDSYVLADSENYLSRCQATWAADTEYNFGVFDAVTDDVLGAIAINAIRPGANSANVGYWIRSDATGRGIATLATRALAVFGIRDRGLTRLEILAQPENLASRRVAEKVGCHFEGIARNRIVFRGEPRAHAVYSLIPEDLRD